MISQDDLQIPSTLRPKLQNLDTPVKAAMIRSSQVLTIPPSSSTTTGPSPSTPTSSPTKSKFKGTHKEKKVNKFQTEKYGGTKSSHAPNPFMFNRSGGGSGKTTPKKGGLRRTQSSGSLDGSPRGTLGTPYSQMPPGNPSESSYNLGLGNGQEAALKFMFPSLGGDGEEELVPPPTLAQLQNGYVPPVGHVRGSSFDSGMGSRSDLNLAKNGSQSTVYLNGTGTGSSWGIGTSSGSDSLRGTGNSTVGMSHGNRSRPRVGSGSHGQAVLVKDRPVGSKEKEEGKYGTVRERDWTPAKFSTMLAQTKSIDLEVERLKKLRIMLRNEAAS